MKTVFDSILKLYSDSNYYSKYGKDIWLTIIIFLIIFLLISYFYVMNHANLIKSDWVNKRCDPSVIPFAGLINPSDKTSAFDFTKENFEYCTQSVLGEISKYAFAPLYYLINVVTNDLKTLTSSLNDARGMFNKVRNSVEEQGTDVYGRSLNISLNVVELFQKIKAVLGKTQASLVSGIYTLYGSYITTNSLFLFIYQSILSVLYVMISFIIACFAVGWLFPPTLVAGLSAASFMSILLIPVVVIMTLLKDVFGAADIDVPPIVPTYCFDGDTKIKLNDGTEKPIRKIKLNDTLYDGSKVTAVMKSTSQNQKLYLLNDIIVTGNHTVFHNKLGWIKVMNHPSSKKIDYHGRYLYCINTTTKTIDINNTIFADWDELDDEDINKLKIPIRLNIHKELATGFHPDSLITIDDGRVIKMCELNVNDVLYYGERVKTIIKLDSSDILDSFQEITVDDCIPILATSKIHFTLLYNDNEVKRELIEKPDVMYHIVTDKGYWKHDDIYIKDYNYLMNKKLLN